MPGTDGFSKGPTAPAEENSLSENRSRTGVMTGAEKKQRGKAGFFTLLDFFFPNKKCHIPEKQIMEGGFSRHFLLGKIMRDRQ